MKWKEFRFLEPVFCFEAYLLLNQGILIRVQFLNQHYSQKLNGNFLNHLKDAVHQNQRSQQTAPVVTPVGHSQILSAMPHLDQDF